MVRCITGALAIGIIVALGAPASAQEPPVCSCLDGCAEKPDAARPIDNIKKPDLVLCPAPLDVDDGLPAACNTVYTKLYGDNTDVLIQSVAPVDSLQDAIAKIDARHAALGHTLNVVLGGHGDSGLFCFGPDDATARDQCIGNSPPYAAIVQTNKDKLVGALTGKIDHLIFASCLVGADPNGQGFIKKLQVGLGANLVKAWTNAVWYAPDVWGTVFPENGLYVELPAEKKEIPTVTTWGLVVMGLLVLTAGTTVVLRRRPETA